MAINKYRKQSPKGKQSGMKNNIIQNVVENPLNVEYSTSEEDSPKNECINNEDENAADFKYDNENLDNPSMTDEPFENISFNYNDDIVDNVDNNDDSCNLNNDQLEFDYLENKQNKRDKYKKLKSINNFNRKERIINCQVVIAKLNIQKIGTLEINAPIGLGIDIATGKLTAPVKLEAVGEPVFNPRIVKNTLIIEGFIPSRILVEFNEPEQDNCLGNCFTKLVYIPFQSDIKVKGIKSDDNVNEKVEFQSLSVFGFPDTCLQNGKGTVTRLVLKVILKVDILVSRDCLLGVISRTYDCNS